MGEVIAINISEGKHKARLEIKSGVCKENFGIVGDYYAGKAHKNISFIDIAVLDTLGLSCVKNPLAGSFKENITTRGIDLSNFNVGTRIKIGETIQEITTIGKTCHMHCDIYKENPNCKVPFKTVFTKVIVGGVIKNSDRIEIVI